MEGIKNTKLQGLLQIALPTFGDGRGFFREVLRVGETEKAAGVRFDTKQVNHARSSRFTLRGIHIAPWNKIIYVARGKVQAVIVDCRKDSPTFGQYESCILGDENRIALFVPAGFGNSYLVLSDDADYMYLTDFEWAPGIEKSITWNDPDLKIEWQLEGNEPVLSEKDKHNPHI